MGGDNQHDLNAAETKQKKQEQKQSQIFIVATGVSRRRWCIGMMSMEWDREAIRLDGGRCVVDCCQPLITHADRTSIKCEE